LRAASLRRQRPRGCLPRRLTFNSAPSESSGQSNQMGLDVEHRVDSSKEAPRGTA
jgi:hypothetical protein